MRVGVCYVEETSRDLLGSIPNNFPSLAAAKTVSKPKEPLH